MTLSKTSLGSFTKGILGVYITMGICAQTKLCRKEKQRGDYCGKKSKVIQGIKDKREAW